MGHMTRVESVDIDDYILKAKLILHVSIFWWNSFDNWSNESKMLIFGTNNDQGRICRYWWLYSESYNNFARFTFLVNFYWQSIKWEKMLIFGPNRDLEVKELYFRDKVCQCSLQILNSLQKSKYCKIWFFFKMQILEGLKNMSI